MRKKHEDIKEVIRSCKSKQDIQCNGQKKYEKRANIELENITQKINDRAKRTGLLPEMISGATDE